MMEPVLLYDGVCPLCSWSAGFVLRHDRRRTLRFAQLQGAFGRSLLSRHPDVRGLDTLIWYEPAEQGRPERLHTRSRALLQVLRYLGGPWRMGLIAAAVPRALLDALYRLVARNRRRLFSGDACLLPSVADRDRFLE